MKSVYRNVRPNYHTYYCSGNAHYVQSFSVGRIPNPLWRNIQTNLDIDGYELIMSNLLNIATLDRRLGWVNGIRDVVLDLISLPSTKMTLMLDMPIIPMHKK